MKHNLKFTLLAGILATNMADSILYMLVVWYFNETYSSPLLLSAVFAIVSILDTFSFLFGPLIDRTGAKKNLFLPSVLQILCTVVLLVCSAGFGMTSQTKGVALVGILFFTYLCSTVIYPSGDKLIPRLVGEDELVGTNSLFQTSQKVLDIFFNGISTVLITYVRFNAIVLLILAFFVAASAVYRMVAQNVDAASLPEDVALLPEETAAAEDGEDDDSDYNFQAYLEDLKDGIAAVRSHFEIMKLFLPLCFVNLFYGIAIMELPVVAKLYVANEAYGYGTLLVCSSVGGVFGSFLMGKIGDSLKNPMRYTSLFLGVAGVAWLAMSAALPMFAPLAMAFIFVSNAAINMMNIMFIALIQKNIEETMLGRVSTFTESLVSLMIPIGNFAGGFAQAVIPSIALEASYGVALVVCAVPFLVMQRGERGKNE